MTHKGTAVNDSDNNGFAIVNAGDFHQRPERVLHVSRRQIIVRIIDRGPFVSQRVTDLSKAAAVRLGVTKEKEEVRVRLELVSSRNSEISQAKERHSSNETPNEQPHSTPSSQRVDINTKGVEEKHAVLKEYNYVPRNANRTTAQKKNLK